MTIISQCAAPETSRHHKIITERIATRRKETSIHFSSIAIQTMFEMTLVVFCRGLTKHSMLHVKVLVTKSGHLSVKILVSSNSIS